MKKVKIVGTLILAVYIVVIPFITFFYRPQDNLNLNTENSKVGQVIMLWHIESFEGGSGNRANFISKMATDYEKKNKGYYVIVKNLSEEEAIDGLLKGDRPDLISFSHSIGADLSIYLSELNIDTSNIRTSLLEYGKLDGEQLAVPYLLSGYCLIGNGNVNSKVLENLSASTAFTFNVETKKGIKPSLIVGTNENEFSIYSLLSNTDIVGNLTSVDDDFESMNSFEAYSKFTNQSSSAVLLGTARDYYRVKNKENLGVMGKCSYVPLGEFTDLIQYLGVIVQSSFASDFIEYLVSQEVQKQISSIGLFSVTSEKIYSDEHYSCFENVLLNELTSINVFMSDEEKNALIKKAMNKIFNLL